MNVVGLEPTPLGQALDSYCADATGIAMSRTEMGTVTVRGPTPRRGLSDEPVGPV